MIVADLRKVLDEYDGGCPLAIADKMLYVGEDSQWHEVGRMVDPEDCYPESAHELS